MSGKEKLSTPLMVMGGYYDFSVIGMGKDVLGEAFAECPVYTASQDGTFCGKVGVLIEGDKFGTFTVIALFRKILSLAKEQEDFNDMRTWRYAYPQPYVNVMDRETGEVKFRGMTLEDAIRWGGKYVSWHKGSDFFVTFSYFKKEGKK